MYFHVKHEALPKVMDVMYSLLGPKFVPMIKMGPRIGHILPVTESFVRGPEPSPDLNSLGQQKSMMKGGTVATILGGSYENNLFPKMAC